MVSKIIPITWYIEPPIDFEHKQYVLLGYLQEVDSSFLKRQLSPHFLYMEKMLGELTSFHKSFYDFSNEMDRRKYIYLQGDDELNKDNNSLIYEIKEIVDFSIPQISARINFGKIILQKNNQILY